MAENFLQYPDIHTAVLIHKRCGCMTQLMRGIAPPPQSGGFQVRFYYLLHPAWGKRCTGAGRNKQIGLIRILGRLRANGKPDTAPEPPDTPH